MSLFGQLEKITKANRLKQGRQPRGAFLNSMWCSEIIFISMNKGMIGQINVKSHFAYAKAATNSWKSCLL